VTTGVIGQVSLFGDAEEACPSPTLWRPDLTRISWSHSRRSTLEQCARRYYYEYFGANKRTAKHDPLKEQLHFLKGVQNRYLRTGTILHLVINTYLRKARQGGVQEAERLVSWARKMFAADRAYSRRYMESGRIADREKYPPIALWEYLSGYVQADNLCDEAEERLIAAIRSFVMDDQYDAFRAAGSEMGSLIEHGFKLPGFPCQVTGKVDLVYDCDGRVAVVDWKIGVGDGSGDDSLQLAVYALWAVDHFGCKPEMLRVCKVHFASDEIIDFRTDVEVLATARARVLQDAERLAVMDEYGRNGVSEAFTPCAHLAVCRLCPFCGVCPEGKDLVHA